MAGASTAFFFVFERIIVTCFKPLLRPVCKEQKDIELREKRTKKAAISVFKFFFFSFAVGFGYYVNKDTVFTSVVLGGNGDESKIWENFPEMQIPNLYKEYYLILMGYHVSQTISHLAEIAHPKSDLVDMLLHHFVTCALILFSYMLNYIGPGVTIMYLHDIADLPASLTRVFSETRFKLLTVVVFLITVVAWLLTRLLYLPYLVYQCYKYKPINSFSNIEILLGFLSILVLLHTFWFYMFMKILFNFSKKGETDDHISNVQPEKVKEKLA